MTHPLFTSVTPVKTLVQLTAVAALAFGAVTAHAQAAYPSKPVQLVIPFPPGGATDVIGRLVATQLAVQLGQPVVIDNRAGAGTVVGAAYVAKAEPDGYTLLISSGTTFTINPALQPRLPYDPLKSFEAIGMTGRTGLILLANANVPYKTFKEVAAAAKAKPDRFTYGSYGNGTTAHFTGEMVKHAAGISMLHVPYKGSAPAMTDLMGGQIDFTVDTVAAALPQLKSGRIKAIAVTTDKRSTLLPNVPTLQESGVQMPSMDTWLAVMAPRGLPPQVKARLSKALADVLAQPATRDKLIAAGFEPAYATGAAVEALIAAELPSMRALAVRANIKSE